MNSNLDRRGILFYAPENIARHGTLCQNMANSLLETKLLVVLLYKNCLILLLRKAFLDPLFVFFHGKIGPKGRNCGGGGEGRVLFSPSASLSPPPAAAAVSYYVNFPKAER